MANALEIKDQESLQHWLEDKPVEWAQLIALRAALRVFPLVPDGFDGAGNAVRPEIQVLTLAVWRCLLISPGVRKYSTEEMRAAATAATATATAAAATAATTAAATAAATAATAAARAATATTTATAAAAAADAASSATAATAAASATRAAAAAWETVRSDCQILERDGPEPLEKAPLWLEQQPAPNGEAEPVIATPRWVADAAANLAKDLSGLLGPDAELIADWYRPLLSGDATPAWQQMFLGERARNLALRKDAFWEVTEKREAETIMEDIAAALRWEKRNPWGLDPNDEDESAFIFLSHARADRPRATAVRQMLLDQGIQVWWDDDIAGGDGWRDRIAERLEKSAAVLTLWSGQSVGRDAVREEAARAQIQRKLVHAKLDQAELPYGFGETHYIDLRSWDGTATHEAWRKLVQALRDKLSPPGPAEIKQRLADSSPVAMVAEAGRLSPRDTPPNARPVIINAPDLEQRLAAIRLSYGAIRPRVDSGQYQVPQDLVHSLEFIAKAINSEPLTWYGIEDGCHSLCNCMTDHDAANSWNTTLCKDLERLAKRLNDLQPLLQPEQVPVGEPGAKPPEPEPVVRQEDVGKVEDMAESLRQILASDAAKAVLSDAALSFGEAGAVQIADAQSITDPDKQLPVVRRGLKRMTYIVGGIVSAIGGGVIINLLTAPEAAATLAARLKPLYDLMIGFF